jgi:DNA (cytosine-5)-methyltransferase 1
MPRLIQQSLMDPRADEFSCDLAIARGVVTRTISIRGRETTTSRPLTAQTGEGHSAWWRSYLEQGPAVLEKAPGPKRTLNVIDLFSSVGGLSLGFEEAARAGGYATRVKLAADVDADALEVYKRNHEPRFIVNESVADLVDFAISGRGSTARFSKKPKIASPILEKAGKIDVILAGPPCQGHSSLNNHSRGDDPRNELYLTVPAIALATGARAVIIENVPNVVRDKQGVVATTIQLLTDAGYHVTSTVLSANKLGWPQTRRRYFLVATLAKQPVDLAFVASTLAHDPLPLSWAIGDLLGAKNIKEGDVFNSVPKMSLDNQKRMQWLIDNDEFNLPDRMRPPCHRDGNHTYSSIYGRMDWNKPAGTITGGFLTPGRGRFVHPKRPRVMTPHEAARVQGFPDSFDFSNNLSYGPVRRGNLTKWIGDAVPPILGYAAGLSSLGGI